MQLQDAGIYLMASGPARHLPGFLIPAAMYGLE
jgi:hypothetical protein